jgi:alpha-beta hydrolase superfamily lysophospholipase
VRSRHAGLPVYLLGESMGGAVAMAAMAGVEKGDPQAVDGLILSAPAVWGRATMNPFYRGTLWLSAHVMPWNYADGRDFRIQASDNIEMLRALGRDPLTYKHARIDVVYGLVNMMDAGLEAAGRLHLPVLLLYGARDEVIPRKPVDAMLAHLTAPHRVVLYPDGWHLLFRDLQRRVVWRDVAAWAMDPAAPLPSGFERDGGPLFAGR